MEFIKLNNVQAFKDAMQVIITSEASIRLAADEWFEPVVSGVLAGDNVQHVNQFIGAYSGIRQQRVIAIVKRYLPYVFDKDTNLFTKKDTNKHIVARKLEAFEAFVNSPGTCWELVEAKQDADKKPVDFAKKLAKDTAGALEQGLTIDGILAIVQAAAAAAHAAEMLKAAPAAPEAVAA